MPDRTAVALAIVVAAAAAYASLRSWQSLREGPVLLAGGRLAAKEPWADGRQWIEREGPCDGPACADERRRQRVAALRARGWTEFASCVATDNGTWVVLGRRGGMPVVYVPGQGTVVMSPSQLDARRRPGPPVGAPRCF